MEDINTPEISRQPQFAAIPTVYHDIQFRSRQEATWALFFDVIGIKWEYEPLDFNGYIPDFLLTGLTRDVYVEVKPATRYEHLAEHHQKAFNAGVPELIVVGAFPFENSRGDFVLGNSCFYESCFDYWEQHKEIWDEFGDQDGEIEEPGPFPDIDGTECLLVNGEVLGGTYLFTQYGELFVSDVTGELDLAWKIAKNRLQWKAKR